VSEDAVGYEVPARGIVIVGAGGHGRGILEILAASARARGVASPVRGFLDDAPGTRASVAGVPILGGIRRAGELREQNQFVIGVGDPRARARVASALDEIGVEYARAVHPSAILYGDVSLEEGAVIAAGVVVAAATKLGAHALLNLNATVGHDCELGRFATIGPGANLGGNVRMEEGAFVGLNGTVLPGRSMGAWSTLGAGSVLLEDLRDATTAFGVPARVIRRAGEVR
jgi:sugar O-acyltransferase (sialic acid O-acetyltransferase NeuD family)